VYRDRTPNRRSKRVRLPKRPPEEAELWKEIATNPSLFLKLLQEVSSPTVDGKYLHWDELRHRHPPAELSHQAWWLGLKFHRKGCKITVPLEDRASEPFSFGFVEPLWERLHQIDQWSGGMVQIPEPVTNKESREQYIIHSLIEEAITSSQLEGAATTRKVAKEMIRQGRKPIDRDERMIFNNYKTMEYVRTALDQPLSPKFVFEIHRIVTDGTLDDPSAAGRLRLDEEYRVVGDDEGTVFHEPPPAHELERRLVAMCAFANKETPTDFIHPAIRSMILHFWLAYDHPFVDGNGRTARAIFYWSMLKNGYWLFEFISISRILLQAPAKYGQAFLFTETDDNDLTYFLLHQVHVICRAIEDLRSYVEKRTREMRSIETELRGLTFLNHRQRQIMVHALKHPSFLYTIESHRQDHGIVYETARTDLLGLADRGLLTKVKRGNAWTFMPAADLEARLHDLNA
jgi:Fic family protein